MKRFLIVLLLAGCAGDSPKPKGTESSSTNGKNPTVVMKTSMGTIKIELFEDKAPVTVKNFLQYVDDKHYDRTIFHRVIPSFMIQGGGFRPGLSKARTEDDIKGSEKPTRASIKNESSNNLSNKKYTLAMARTRDPDSATAQFFINVENNDRLDRANSPDETGYCVFGKVIDGTDVVEKIKNVKTFKLIPRVFEDVPEEDVIIESVRRADE
jgi:cyclophilin family peptidyl-prolyl cis-trans isomerase